MRRISLLLTGIIALGCLRSAQAQSGGNLIVNGGFETGSFSGWSVTGETGYADVTRLSHGYFQPDSGTYYAMLGSMGAESDLSQNIATSVGSDYAFAFDLASDGGLTNQLTVSAGSDVLLNLSDIPVSGYTLYTGSFIADSADTTFSIGTRDDPGYLLLDNVVLTDPVITASAVVPLPSSVWMSGLLFVAFLSYRAVRRTAVLA